jgi:hypothetical protein
MRFIKEGVNSQDKPIYYFVLGKKEAQLMHELLSKFLQYTPDEVLELMPMKRIAKTMTRGITDAIKKMTEYKDD